MNKDQTFYVPVLCLLFLLGLTALRYLPPITILGYEVKTIDMFSDIEKDATPEASADIPKIKPKIEIECPKGQTCFEDYSENQDIFKPFSLAIDQINTGRKVRIAFFGDSFIEGDVLCGDFRDLLQEKFGGNGVGWLPVTSEVSQFRQTIKEDFKGFQSFDVVHNSKEKLPYPPFGVCAIPQANNHATYYTTNFSPRTNFLPGFRLFYQSGNTFTMNVSSDGNSQRISLKPGNTIQSETVSYTPARKVSLSFSDSPKTFLYGVSFEGEPGVYVDNFSLRGNAGFSLLSSTTEMHKALNQIQDYQLIILQYGVNAVNEKTKDLAWYIRMMNKVIAEIKTAYPQAAILLVGVGDRSKKINGEYKTMPTIKLMVEAQRAIAAENKIAFWNMFEAMGGENSMVSYVKSQPPKANLDYTHLNFSGGKDIGTLLFKSLLFEYEKNKAE